MNGAQTRVVDQVLTEFARGYVQGEFVGRKLFPRVPVQLYGGTTIAFGKEAFKRYKTKRAPGSATARITFGYEGKPYVIVPNALEAVVPRENVRDAEKGPGIDLKSKALSITLDAMGLSHEGECADLATNPNNYGADNKTKFTSANSWAVGDSDPIRDIVVASNVIRGSIGMHPNRLLLSPVTLIALQQHPKIKEHFKYTTATQITIPMIQSLIGNHIEVFEAPAVFSGSNSEDFGDVWGNHAILAYVSDVPDKSKERPSYGYTYFIDGHPFVEKEYYDNTIKSFVNGVTDDNSPIIVGPDAGFLFESAGVGVMG